MIERRAFFTESKIDACWDERLRNVVKQGEAGVNGREHYRGFALDFVRDGKMVIILGTNHKVIDVFDTNRSGVRDELRTLDNARIDEELGGPSQPGEGQL